MHKHTAASESPGIRKNKKITFRKLDLLPSSGEEREETPTLFGPFEGDNLNH
jgi:hypothetical protein